jgi:hypothetical protein
VLTRIPYEPATISWWSVENPTLEPDQLLALLVDRVLKARVAKGKRPGDRLERLRADGDANQRAL